LLGLLALLPAGMQRDDVTVLIPVEGEDAASTIVSLQLANEYAGRLTMLAPLREAALLEVPANDIDRSRLIKHFISIAQESGNAGRKAWSDVRERVTRESGNLDAACLLAIDAQHKFNLIDALRGLARFYRFTTMGSVKSLAYGARRFEDENDVEDAASCLMSLGAIAVRRLDDELAEKYFARALPMFRQVNSLVGEAHCIQGMGRIEFDRFRYPEAEARYREAEKLYERTGNLLGKANCIRGLGDVARRTNAPDLAKKSYETAIPLYQEVGDTLGEAICNKGRGDMALDFGDLVAAHSAFQLAIPLFHELGDILREAECRQGLGDILEKQGQIDAASEQWRAALAMYERIGYPFNIGHAHTRLARVAIAQEEQASHLAAARVTWLSIDRFDLVKKYIDTVDSAHV
jgi:tetratricopeptide (TPR) repeat protein